MITRSVIEDILELCVNAPSGDNSQPWRFEVCDGVISVYNTPDSDNPVLNYRQRGSHFAHGGLIENVVIAAGKFGYAADVRVFPNPCNDTHTADILLRRADTEVSPLTDCIVRRHTNRRQYSNDPISEGDMSFLRNSVKDLQHLGSLSFVFIEDVARRRVLAECASSVERVILENRTLHHLLFKDVVWSEAQEKKVRAGMFIDTLELAPPQKLAFRMARRWGVMRVLNGLGISRQIAASDAKLYATGAGMGALVLPGVDGAKDFLLAGRAMQRLWLTATRLGLFAQPLAGLLFAAMGLAGERNAPFSDEHVALIRRSNSAMREILKATASDTVAMMFRLGHADPPSATCSKRPPVIEFREP